MKDTRIELGREGEKLATSFLRKKGFEILAVNQRLYKIQVDIIASTPQRNFVVEVKFHSWSGSGFEEIIRAKQRQRLLSVAMKLHRSRAGSRRWGFLLIWVRSTQSCEILENVCL